MGACRQARGAWFWRPCRRRARLPLARCRHHACSYATPLTRLHCKRRSEERHVADRRVAPISQLALRWQLARGGTAAAIGGCGGKRRGRKQQQQRRGAGHHRRSIGLCCWRMSRQHGVRVCESGVDLTQLARAFKRRLQAWMASRGNHLLRSKLAGAAGVTGCVPKDQLAAAAVGGIEPQHRNARRLRSD